MDQNETADLDSTTTEEEAPVVQAPKGNNVAKLLAQRNEARKELEATRQQLEQTKSEAQKLKDLEELVARQAIEKDSEKERWEFFSKNEKAKEFENGINDLKNKYNLSYDDAYRLHLAQTKPELLVDEQYRNKGTSNTGLTWVGKEPELEKDPGKMTADEFLKRSDSLARWERLNGWLLR